MSRALAALLATMATVSTSAEAAAQEPRAQMIEDARIALEPGEALELLVAAASPVDGAVDSLGSVAVYALAEVLLDQDADALASVWLRWLARHGADWPTDPTALATVVAAYEEAAAAVASESPAGLVRTSWTWPTGFDADAEGSLVVGSSAPGVDLSVEVVGRGSVEGAEPADLPPGTYDVVASADGHESLRVTREVLPGGSTVLDVTLPPMLSSEAEAAVGQWLARVDRTIGGTRACGTGFIAAADGLVLTTVGVAGTADGPDVLAFGGQETHDSVRVVAYDEARNLAVLHLDAETGRIGRAPRPLDRAFAWAVHYPGCAPPVTNWTRLGAWSDGADSVTLTAPLPAAAVGAPLVDRTGELLGIVVDRTRFVPASRADAVLEEARQSMDVIASAGGGGMPTWIWVALGAGAAAGAAVALGGGGDSPPPTNTPPPPVGTGGITITFPLGGN